MHEIKILNLFLIALLCMGDANVARSTGGDNCSSFK